MVANIDTDTYDDTRTVMDNTIGDTADNIDSFTSTCSNDKSDTYDGARVVYDTDTNDETTCIIDDTGAHTRSIVNNTDTYASTGNNNSTGS